MSTGLRLICFLLVPASVAAAVLATPIVRLLYQHGNFGPSATPIVAACLAAFALGLTFNGTMLMLNRGFFSLQSPWIPSWVALGNLGLNAVLDAVFYRFGIWGIPLSTSLVNIAGTWALLVFFRRRMGGFGLGETSPELPSRHRGVGGARRGGVGGLVCARRGARPVAARADRLARRRARPRLRGVLRRVPAAGRARAGDDAAAASLAT